MSLCQPTKVGHHAQLVQSAARKLEYHKTIFVLTVGEYRAARDLVNAAVAFVNEYLVQHPRTKKMSRAILFRGAKYYLNYTTLEGAHVCVTGSKVRFSSAGFST